MRLRKRTGVTFQGHAGLAKSFWFSFVHQEAIDMIRAKNSMEGSRQGMGDQLGSFCSSQTWTGGMEVKMDK